MIKVMLLGPHLTSKGGITSVLKNYINFSENNFCSFNMHAVRRDGSKFGKLLYFFPSLISYIYKLCTKKNDIIHIHLSNNMGFYRYIPFIFIGKVFSKKIVLHMHAASFEFYFNTNRFVKGLIRKTFNKGDVIIALSESWAEVFGSITNNKIIIINNSVPTPKENFYNINAKKITFMGFIGPRKGLFDLLKSFSQVSSRIESKLIICGSGEIDKMNIIIKEYNIHNNIEFHGWITPKERDLLLRGTAVFVLPSYNEGLPMVILEAMAYGIPIISTTVGGIPELVKKDNGFLISPGNINLLSKSIIMLLNDNEMRKEMSEKNYYKIRDNYSMTYTFSKLKDVYFNVLSH